MEQTSADLTRLASITLVDVVFITQPEFRPTHPEPPKLAACFARREIQAEL
jgi:hypothetical protein